MKQVVRMTGFRELDFALSELPKTIARNAVKKALAGAAEPIAEEARRLVPVDHGQLRDSISVSPKLKNKAGNAEFAAAMRAGLGKAAAVQAMRDARRAQGAAMFAEFFVGPAVPDGFYGHLIEFGTSKVAAQPFMRPAWDTKKNEALGMIKDELSGQIIAAAKRIARSKNRSDDVKYRASIAAMIAAGV